MKEKQIIVVKVIIYNKDLILKFRNCSFQNFRNFEAAVWNNSEVCIYLSVAIADSEMLFNTLSFCFCSSLII